MKGGYVQRPVLGSQCTALRAARFGCDKKMVVWKRVIREKLLLFQPWTFLKEGKKLLLDLHENSSPVFPSGETGGSSGESLRWTK